MAAAISRRQPASATCWTLLRTARLWLPLPADGATAIRGTAVTLPTISYLGSDFVPAYSLGAALLQLQLAAGRADGRRTAVVRRRRPGPAAAAVGRASR